VARSRARAEDFARPVRRVLVGGLLIFLIALFALWRIDNPRAERFRAMVVDRFVPSFDWAFVPVTAFAGMIEDFQSYARIHEQNQELKRELQQMKAWKEAALQLEQENAKLLALNEMQLEPKLTYIGGVVLADSGSPFRQSVLLNVGSHDGIRDGWAATDGLGLVGRISGVGANSSRVLMLTDSSSRLPITIQPSGQTAILTGQNVPRPLISFLEAPDQIRPGDRVVSSGDGRVFPAGLLVGQVALGNDGRFRVSLAADYERLEFLRVLRSKLASTIEDPGSMVAPLPAFQGPQLPREAADG